MNFSPSVEMQRCETGLEYLKINSTFCSAKIFLQGAQLTEFTPKGQKPLVWVSEDEDYQPGKGVRGGIPVCWPWFGVHADPEWPIHGVARKTLWRAEEVNESENQITISFTLPMLQVDKTFWPHKSELRIIFELSDTLKVSLINTNLGTEQFELTQALHTYFPTSDIHETQVDGLQNAQYIEFGEGPYQQNDIVSFARETDMVYTEASPRQVIRTPEGHIEVVRENSSSCVLWNPWIEKSIRLSNFKDDEYLSMLCLEAANVMNDKVTLAPGESHTLTTIIRWID